MKKTKFQKFMAKTTKAAMDQEGLDTFAEHLEYARLLIELELCKKGVKKEKSIEEKKPEREGNVLSTIVSGLIFSWTGLKRIFNFLKEGNNLMLVVIGLIVVYAAIMMALGMV